MRLVLIRHDGDEQLAAHAAHELRRRQQRIRGDGDDAAHLIHLQSDHAGDGVRDEHKRLLRTLRKRRIEALAQIDHRDHFVAQDDDAFHERRRGGHGRGAGVRDDLPHGHDVEDERLRADAEGDEAELLLAHARTRNLRTSSSRLRIASESSVSDSPTSPASVRLLSAMARTCCMVATIFSDSEAWFAATWKISWIMSIIRSAALEIMAEPDFCSTIAWRTYFVTSRICSTALRM